MKKISVKQPTMLVSLDDIWSKKSDAINKVLKKSETSFLEVLPNKIKVAQLYSKTKQLIPEDRVIVNHHQFISVALALGRLEDIKARIMLLLTLEPLFNERNLLALLSDYNPVKKLYLFTTKLFSDSSITTYNVETLSIEKVINTDNYSYPFYYKGFMYVTVEESYLAAIDLASNEKFVFPQTEGCSTIRTMIFTSASPLLYYLDEDVGFLSFNLGTLEVVLQILASISVKVLMVISSIPSEIISSLNMMIELHLQLWYQRESFLLTSNIKSSRFLTVRCFSTALLFMISNLLIF
jgi:hypothetical protein